MVVERKNQFVKMSTSPTAAGRLDTPPTIPTEFLKEKKILRLIWNHKNLQRAKAILRKKMLDASHFLI